MLHLLVMNKKTSILIALVLAAVIALGVVAARALPPDPVEATPTTTSTTTTTVPVDQAVEKAVRTYVQHLAHNDSTAAWETFGAHCRSVMNEWEFRAIVGHGASTISMSRLLSVEVTPISDTEATAFNTWDIAGLGGRPQSWVFEDGQWKANDCPQG